MTKARKFFAKARKFYGKFDTFGLKRVMPESEREASLDRIRAYLASKPETAHGEFTLPMLTGVLRTRRR